MIAYILYQMCCTLFFFYWGCKKKIITCIIKLNDWQQSYQLSHLFPFVSHSNNYIIDVILASHHHGWIVLDIGHQL